MTAMRRKSILSSLFLISGSFCLMTVKAEEKLTSDMTDVAAAYEDSIYNSLYPPAHVCEYSGDEETFKWFDMGQVNVEEAKKDSQTNADSGAYDGLYRSNAGFTVGSVKINSAISQTGAKTYEVPINIYPGINGFQPKLSLRYNSQQRDGYVGTGWSLGGLSMITRTGKTIFYDGQTEGIKLDDTDNFMLDGVRLIPIEESTNKIKYESETGNIRVVGTCSGSVMKNFEVYYPDGSKGFFGYPFAGNQTEYPILSLTDTYGNVISYNYKATSAPYLVSTIKYNGCEVSFEYQDRSFTKQRYVAGSIITDQFLLKNIIVKYSDKILGKYALSYNETEGNFLLKLLTFVVENQPLMPLKFEYANESSNRVMTASKLSLPKYYSSSERGAIRYSMGRFDYHNCIDGMLALPNKTSYWRHHASSSLFKHSENRFDNKYGENEDIYFYHGFGNNIGNRYSTLKTQKGFIDVFFIDLKGDQKENVVKINNVVENGKDKTAFNVYRIDTITGLRTIYDRTYSLGDIYTDARGDKSAQPKFYFGGDYDGDGKSEILAVSVEDPFGDGSMKSRCYIIDLENDKVSQLDNIISYQVEFTGNEQGNAIEAENNSDKLFVIDVNGDGKSELCHVDMSGLHIYTFTKDNSNSFSLKSKTTYTGITRISLQSKYITGDFNGDGACDILRNDHFDGEWTIYYSMGDGQFDQQSYPLPNEIISDYNDMYAHDVDHDGKCDIIRYDDKSMFIYLTGKNSAPHTTIQVLFNNDGATVIPTTMNTRNDFVELYAVKDELLTKYSYNHNVVKDMLLTKMTNSMGVVEENDYCFINKDGKLLGKYQAGNDALFPYVNISEQIPVVYRITKKFGDQILDKESIEYENAVYHAQGLGFCGFSKIQNTNHRGLVSSKVFNPYKYGVLTNEYSDEIDKTYSYDIGRNDDNLLQLRLKSIVEEQKLKGFNVTTNYSYDNYGNPTSRAEDYGDGVVDITNWTYSSSPKWETGYHTGVIKTQKETNIRKSLNMVKETMFALNDNLKPSTTITKIGTEQIERHDFLYDSKGNTVSESVTPYSSTNKLVATNEYDSYGRITKSTDIYGLETSYSYDSYGRQKSREDVNGKTSFDYTLHGVLGKKTFPDGKTETITHSWDSSSDDAVFSVTSKNSDGREVSTVYDCLGREIVSSENTLTGELIFTEKSYNQYGELEKESLPHRKSGTAVWNEYDYDIHGRMTTSLSANGIQTDISYGKNSVTETTNGVSKVTTYDCFGNIVSIKDLSGTTRINYGLDGQPISFIAPNGTATGIGYDSLRRRSTFMDPSLGLTSYEYDPAGNLSKETNAKGEEISLSYDNLNRLVKKKTSELTADYSYNSKNLIESIEVDNGYSNKTYYDDYGKVNKKAYKLNHWNRTQQLTIEYYPDETMPDSIVYSNDAGRVASEKRYYSNGHLTKIILNDTTAVLDIKASNQFGKPTLVATGIVNRMYAYDNYGRPTIRRAVINDKAIQTLRYAYDDNTSNISNIQDYVHNLNDSFEYDDFDRLTRFGDKTAEYSDNGNIVELSDVGTFSYNLSGKPYSVSSIATSGELIPTATQRVEYTSFQRPSKIVQGRDSVSLIYDQDYNRIGQHNYSNGGSTKFYFGDVYEKSFIHSVSIETIYIGGDYYTAPAVYMRLPSNPWKVYYIVRDHLGSVTHFVDSSGKVINELSYDAWGRMRDPETHEVYTTNHQLPSIGRGYCGHEHIGFAGLVNMNARLYDPAIGRFLSPDPQIQAPENSQNFNRYSYALNNPLKYNDPDGESFWTVFSAVTDFWKNVFSHGFNVSRYNWRRTVNSWRIDMGLFRGSALQVLNKFTWGGVQSLVGNTLGHRLNLLGMVDNVTEMDGMLAIGGITNGSAAFTIGHLSFGPKNYVADWRDHLFVHEYGHYIQSQFLGPSFFIVVGAPSLLSAGPVQKWSGIKHINRWFEVDASRRGANHFDAKYGSGCPGYVEYDSHFFNRYYFETKKWRPDGYNLNEPYQNPRFYDPSNPNSSRIQNGSYPTSGSKHNFFWDFIFL